MKKLDRFWGALLFVFVSVGHPAMFWLLLWFYGLFDSIGSKVLFYSIGSNTYKIKLWLFIVSASFVYFICLSLQVLIIRLFRKINIRRFIEIKLSIIPIIISALGFVNLALWCGGMEGNVFGFIIALPLLGLTLISFIVFLVFLVRAILGKYDEKRSTPLEVILRQDQGS